MAAFDHLIIGGGLSGLAAGVRLARFGGRVALFESHTALGGLNSFYRRGDAVHDVGLHAMTNFAPSSDGGSPLNLVLRQLRLSRDELELCPQGHSAIVLPGTRVVLDNDFGRFTAQLKALFPKSASGLDELVRRVEEVGYTSLAPSGLSARSVIMACTADRRLADLLCLPVMYYGNARAGDMDFTDFAILFKSVLQEGLCRPREGMPRLIGLLRRRFEEAGGLLRTGCAVRRILTEGGRAVGVVDARGETHEARHLLSTIGAVETLALVDGASAAPQPLASCRPGGAPGFVECLFKATQPPARLGFTECVEFVCQRETFDFAPPADPLAEPDSFLVCAPANYVGMAEGRGFRVSCLTDGAFWLDGARTEEAYRAAKAQVAQACLTALRRRHPRLAEGARTLDVFTPRTLRRFTGHRNGALYGSPDKCRDGQTGVGNLRLAGTDHGLCGIVGSMLSGILVANDILRKQDNNAK